MKGVRPVPIQESDLGEVAAFLHANLNARVAVSQWAGSVSHAWCDWRPDLGMQLRDGTRLVGVLLAIYSEQEIEGQRVRFCNPHSWCVLKEYRQQSIGLVTAMIRRPGFTYTMLTPNPRVAEVFRALGFKDLQRGFIAFPNLPFGARSPGVELASGEDDILHLLGPVQRRDYTLHRSIPWLRFVAIGRPGTACLVIYKKGRWKRLPSARLIHVSDPAAFAANLAPLRRHLLIREGLFTSHIERRVARAPLPFGMTIESLQPKLWSGTPVPETAISNLYSELMSLDI